MIDRFINDLALKAKSSTGASGEVAIWAIAGMFFALIATVFLSLAAYTWLAILYSSAAAWLIVGAAQLAIAAALVWRCAYVRNRNRATALAQIELAAKQAQAGWKIDPAYLAIGLEVAKAVGVRNIIPLVVGGLAAGLAGAKNAKSSGHPRH
jgi:hypothetical protein